MPTTSVLCWSESSSHVKGSFIQLNWSSYSLADKLAPILQAGGAGAALLLPHPREVPFHVAATMGPAPPGGAAPVPIRAPLLAETTTQGSEVLSATALGAAWTR